MPDFSSFPRALQERVRSVRLGAAGVPALLAHPDWERPAPFVLWMHGRTVSKELDPGRYLRWVRAGIGACAIDLPGHGERYDAALQHPRATLDIVERAVGEIDHVLEALADQAFGGVFDLDRAGIGGMSAGGMVTLRRLCDPHPFACAAVEATTGWLSGLYFPESGAPFRWPVDHPRERVERLDPMLHLAGFRPIPLLALHGEDDKVVPLAVMERFLEALRGRYAAAGADPALIEFKTWAQTGAPEEHAGFGRFGNDAKNAQVDFLVRRMRG